MTEEQLIHLLVQKDESAFRHLVTLYEGKVYATVISFLRADEYADDVAQEVFIKVHESIGDFRRESSLSTWIYRIAVTQSLAFLRKQKRKKRWGAMFSLFGEDNAPRFEEVSYHHPGLTLENKEMGEALFKAIDQLPETQKTAFTLHKLKGLSYEEVSEVMNLTLSSVESLMHRANTNLRKYLFQYYKNL